MHRKPLLHLLDQYEQTWVTGLLPYRSFDRKEEADNLRKFREFVLEFAGCFDRSLEKGHVTASAMVINPKGDGVLLTLHQKLGKWLQLGGHTDGVNNVAEEAMREAREESGLTELQFVGFEERFGPGLAKPAIFDIDIHYIPPGKDPGHYHFDARFLIVSTNPEQIQISPESKDLKWIPLTQAYELAQERSMHRQFDKVKAVTV